MNENKTLDNIVDELIKKSKDVGFQFDFLDKPEFREVVKNELIRNSQNSDEDN